ncbi:DUF1150 family protein [Azospirillum isscasi]|uniref:DUF1150 family protein n=1 Tax=Azospirillum isscasi TaxID=3053926 RepID=A0ABU0WGM2_9PROT|nr:DUF1150 family protein [Azospirillum isscasi]MDQ2103348.1 DUF1150 family protein [Azospirillum isscasi]
MTAPRSAAAAIDAAIDGFDTGFARHGILEVAYLRSVQVDGVPVFAVHAADGTRLWLDTDRAAAGAALQEHGMELVSLH